jgi:hypothetical protein
MVGTSENIGQSGLSNIGQTNCKMKQEKKGM